MQGQGQKDAAVTGWESQVWDLALFDMEGGELPFADGYARIQGVSVRVSPEDPCKLVVIDGGTFGPPTGTWPGAAFVALVDPATPEGGYALEAWRLDPMLFGNAECEGGLPVEAGSLTFYLRESVALVVGDPS